VAAGYIKSAIVLDHNRCHATTGRIFSVNRFDKISPALSERGGIYLENSQIAAAASGSGNTGVESYAVDVAAAHD
jgi:hypothetical protein